MKIIQQLIGVIFLLSSMNIFGQTVDLETETAFMNCLYGSLPDKGEEFKSVFQKAEVKLIEKKILKDGTGKSYVTLYKNPNKLINAGLGDLGLLNYTEKIERYFRTEETTKCMVAIYSDKKYENSKLSKSVEYIESLIRSSTGKREIAAKILEILDAKDFEHDYYKYATITMIEAINMMDTHDLKLPEETAEQKFTEEELKRALKVEIDSESSLFINDKKTTLKELQKKVISYLKQNKSKSVILMKNSKKTSYKAFLDMQNEIVAGFKIVRNQLATEKFNRTFDELKEAEKKEIKNIYPLNIKH